MFNILVIDRPAPIWFVNLYHNDTKQIMMIKIYINITQILQAHKIRARVISVIGNLFQFWMAIFTSAMLLNFKSRQNQTLKKASGPLGFDWENGT